MPFIVLDDDKPYYMRGLKNYEDDKMFLIDTIKNEQDIYEKFATEMLNFNLEDKQFNEELKEEKTYMNQNYYDLI